MILSIHFGLKQVGLKDYMSTDRHRLMFRKNGILLTPYYINGKDILLEEICMNPAGESNWKHSYIHHNFRCYCEQCGHSRGVFTSISRDTGVKSI
jgi:hypothetical protein